MAKYVTVEPGPKLAPGEVALWEVSEGHPDGEVMIAAPQQGEEARTYEVGRTPGVNARLADGRLVEKSSRAKAAAADEESEDAPAGGASRRRTNASGQSE